MHLPKSSYLKCWWVCHFKERKISHSEIQTSFLLEIHWTQAQHEKL